MDMIMSFGKLLAYVFLTLVITWVAKIVFDKITVKIDEDCEIAKNNAALGFRRAGFYLAGFIAMAGVVTGSSQGFLNDVFGITVFGVLTYALLFVAGIINERWVLPNVDNDEACCANNTAVGITEFGSYLATGLIINGCVSGNGVSMLEGIALTVVFSLLGQITLVILVHIFHRFEAVDCIKSIEAGNVAAAIYLSGRMVAYGFILRASLSKFDNWLMEFGNFALGAIVGIIMLYVVCKVADLMLPKQHTGASSMLIESAIVIGVSLVISIVIL